MLKNLKQFFAPAPFRDEAHAAYVTLVASSRKPWFYQQQGVPDTVDGRFDVMVLHMFLLIHRLRGETSQEAGQFIRTLSETFFADMDRSLREMGASDTGVSIRIKNMAGAFYGRLQAYEQSLMKPGAFKESIHRNLYRGGEAEHDKLQAVVDYALRNAAHLEQQPAADITGGTLSFLS